MDIATTAKVRFTTSKGNIDVELYAHELPVSCRAFLQNCMDKKYIGLDFDKIENLHVEVTPKELTTKIRREFHSRVKFSSRGNVALLNVEDSSVASPDGFFITMKPMAEFNGRFVVIGKVVGDLIYNVVKILEGEKKEDGVTPKYAVSISGVEVLQPYFEDLKMTKENISVQEPKRKKAKTTVKLSYEDDEDEDEDNGFVMRSAHELLKTGTGKESEEEKKKKNIRGDAKTFKDDKAEGTHGDDKVEETIKDDKVVETTKKEGDTNELNVRDQNRAVDDTQHVNTDDQHQNNSKDEIGGNVESVDSGAESDESSIGSDSGSTESSDEDTEPKRDPSVDPHDPVLDVWKDTVHYSQLQNHRYECR